MPAAWLAVFWLLRDRGKRRQILSNNWTRFSLIWLAWAVITLIWAQDMVQAGQHIIHLFFGLSLPLLIIPLSSKEKEILPLIWVGTAIAIIILGAVQLGNVAQFPPMCQWLTVVYGNENNVAMFICLSIPFLFGYAVSKGDSKWYIKASKLIALLSVAIGAVLILMTSARLSYLALAILTILIPVLNYERWEKNIHRPKWQYIDAIIGVAILITLVIAVLSVPRIRDRLIAQIVSIPQEIKTIITVDPTFARSRLTIEGVKLIINSRGLGVGPGNFEWHMAKNAVKGTPNPHNWWIELLAEYGILVFLGYIIIYGKLIISIFQRWRYDWYWPAGATMAALIMFPFLAVAPSRLIWYSPHWLLLAVAVSIASKE